MTAATTKKASMEIPDSGATREPTHRPSRGAPVQMLSVTTPIAATSATRCSRTFTVGSLPRCAYGFVSSSAHLRALVVSLPASLTHFEYFSRSAFFVAPEDPEPLEPEPEEPEPDAPPR